MDLLKTPSVQSLLDSDLESVESLQYLDIEELDEIEYALPAIDAPTLAEVLCVSEEEEIKNVQNKEEPVSCSPLQIDFLQAVSQQLIQAQERSSTGFATVLSTGTEGKLTVGTAHGHLLSFYEQTLRWVCDQNTDVGAVSCLSYNKDSTRLLAGYARGLICQYESIKGTVLRRLTLGGELWGILRVTWAGTSGLALDTGGSVWLIKFSRPLGVRSARTSCLFSGARGEVVAMSARDARILALATLSRVIIVAGGCAAGVKLSGPPDTLPVIEWSETDNRILICARANTLQWLSVHITGSSISLRPLHRAELKMPPLWLGWLGGNLAILDSDEKLRIWGDEYDKPLDLSYIEPVYASAFFKGHWTDGRVSRALCTAGVNALGGASIANGTLSLLGRKGVVRVNPRDLLARVQAFLTSGRYLQGLRLLCGTQGAEATAIASQFIDNICARPHILGNKHIADQTVKICLKFGLNEELWGKLWEQCSSEKEFVEALGDAIVRDELSVAPPSPDCTQALIERLAEFEPELVERVLASLPLTSLDPHRASVFTREKGLWRGVGAIAAALGGCAGAMRELCAHTRRSCGARCECAGAALLVTAADALAGRAAGGRDLPSHARPSARHDALHALLSDEGGEGGRSPLRVLTEHDGSAAVRLLEQSARDPPFAGPLAKQNRLRVARHLLAFAKDLPHPDDRTEILEFLTGQLNSGALPNDPEVLKELEEVARGTRGERADRAWLALLQRAPPRRPALHDRPRILCRLDVLQAQHQTVLPLFFKIEEPSDVDIDELYEYLRCRVSAGPEAKEQIEPYLSRLIVLRPRAAAALFGEIFENSIATVLASLANVEAVEFAESLKTCGHLKGDAAAVHVRNLCILRPDHVQNFLRENVGIVRPEEALSIVRELGPEDAVPHCLEAAGDPSAALDVLLRLAASTDDRILATRYALEAGDLCTRVTPTVPPSVATDMWARLLKNAKFAPPALILEAVAHLPVDAAVDKTCESSEVALAILACAASRRSGWACAARIMGREAHEALALALRKAGRGRAVRGRCVRCGAQLSRDAAVLATHCGRACHATCGAEPRCGWCGARASDDVFSFNTRSPRRPASPATEFTLLLVAPPRPDLEGSV
ncbi:vacuolar protein sorting-associated protein 8 homolog [Bombyx mori]|uniref:Vacuolar protein sorting-associated protein 8 homolog n=1 Tax=Bombyx mori TaxID=7091 RepID=A0A8R1WL39_BOMMO|nr:vacuolar protein sorting-associated protein 8 homolog [Bombyx mori]